MHDLRLGDNFHTTDALRLGIPRQRLRRADLSAPHFGVRATQPATDIFERCRAFLPAMSSRMVFSHSTAVLIHGLPLPRLVAGEPELHVSSLAPVRASRHAGVHGHQLHLDPAEIHLVRNLPVVGPVEAWCEIGSMVSLTDLVICGDALVRRKAPMSTLEELAQAVESSPFRPGVRMLRRAIALVRPRTDSPMETVLRLAILRAGLPEPEVNFPIPGAGGETIAHGDLVYPTARVVVEYDGDHHRTDDRQYYIDADRLWSIQARGWTVVRINRTHLADGAAEAVRRIRLALAI